MAMPTSQIKTYRLDNRFTITCPVFGSTTEIRMCLHLHTLLWSGKKQEVRRGCQACLHDSKCPMIPLIRDVLHKNADPYWSAEPKHGTLLAKHLDDIRNVIVMDRTMDQFGVPEHERAAIRAVNCYGAKLKGKALLGDKIVEIEALDRPEPTAAPRRKPAEKKPEAPASVVTAAIAGDMTAAISTGEAA